MQCIEIRVWDDKTGYSEVVQRELSGDVSPGNLVCLVAHLKEIVDGVDVEYAETLRTGGCPFCGNKVDVVGGEVNTGVGGNHASQDMSCSACDKTWSDAYILLWFDA